jgi:resuscitation-promoting factor RpfA
LSKCLKCGASLPPVGDCPTCATASQPANRARPSLLDKDIQIDRRREPERAVPLPGLPGVATPAPRRTTPAFGTPSVSASAPRPSSLAPHPSAPPPLVAPAAPLGVAADEDMESFSIDIEEPQEPSAPPRVAVANTAPIDAPTAPVPPATTSKPGMTEIHARPASLWRRLLALTIDTSAISGVAVLYLLLAASVAGVEPPATGYSGLDAFVTQVRALESVLLPGAVLMMLLSFVYTTLSAFLWNGRTLGRRLLGLRLVDTHGLAPAPGRAVVRALLASVSFGFFLAGFWMALFDRRGQTLHDKLTSTYVVQPG